MKVIISLLVVLIFAIGIANAMQPIPCVATRNCVGFYDKDNLEWVMMQYVSKGENAAEWTMNKMIQSGKAVVIPAGTIVFVDQKEEPGFYHIVPPRGAECWTLSNMVRCRR